MKWLALLAVAACNTFEDPTVVIDLRVIAMTASPPEQVLDVDLANPVIGDLVAQLQPSFICATVAEPGRAGGLRWSLTACLPDNGHCDPGRPSVVIASGEALDPESDPLPICTPVLPSPDIVAILADAYENDPVHGLGGLSYSIELRVGGSDADPALDQFALKELAVTARIPADRTPNHNPTFESLQLQSAGNLQLGVFASCANDLPHPSFQAGAKVDLVPTELADTREVYPAATVDGTFRPFTETIRYQWLTTAGSLADEFSGGPPDFAGNIAHLGTTWHAPGVDHVVDAQLWMVQRDERGGVSVYPFCVRVSP